MIRFAEKKDIPYIKELWDIAFGEEPDFNKYFFDNFFKYEDTLLYLEEKPVAMLQMMPYTLKGIGAVTYIYGATTHPDYRKKGLMGKLLEKSFEIDKARGVKGSVLIPANQGLFNYYSKFGYETLSYVDTKVMKSTNELKYTVEKAKIEDLKSMTEIYNNCSEFLIERNEDYFKDQIEMFNALGGEVYVLKDKNIIQSYAFISELHPLKIQEIISKDKEYDQFFINFLINFHCEKFAEVSSVNGLNPIGMGLFYGSKKPQFYMNLMLN